MGELRIQSGEVPEFHPVQWLFYKLRDSGAPVRGRKGLYLTVDMEDGDIVLTGRMSRRIDGNTRDLIFEWEVA